MDKECRIIELQVMKRIAYISALGTLVVFLGCNKNSDTGAGASADSTTRSSGSSESVDTQTRDRSSAASTDTSRSPDNTGKNVRDRSDSTLTPGDQGEDQKDMEMTRRIRRAVTSNDQLSQEAKNVKIITANGKVTLRGPVNSDQERKTIESIVQQQVQGATVDDQLEVKAANQ
jgi:hypothetical protein